MAEATAVAVAEAEAAKVAARMAVALAVGGEGGGRTGGGGLRGRRCVLTGYRPRGDVAVLLAVCPRFY